MKPGDVLTCRLLSHPNVESTFKGLVMMSSAYDTPAIRRPPPDGLYYSHLLYMERMAKTLQLAHTLRVALRGGV